MDSLFWTRNKIWKQNMTNCQKDYKKEKVIFCLFFSCESTAVQIPVPKRKKWYRSVLPRYYTKNPKEIVSGDEHVCWNCSIKLHHIHPSLRSNFWGRKMLPSRHTRHTLHIKLYVFFFLFPKIKKKIIWPSLQVLTNPWFSIRLFIRGIPKTA